MNFHLAENAVENTLTFFEKAIPEPTQKNFSTQVGVHFEEVGEMVEELAPTNLNAKEVHAQAMFAIKQLADLMKRDETAFTLPEENRINFLDAICDQMVTGTGSAYMAKMDILNGFDEVNRSNLSKFDKDGNPIFDENGKIMKSDLYSKAVLDTFV